ncbi:hypothetical protein ACLB2K_027377 [Fragaria x ananassa]
MLRTAAARYSHCNNNTIITRGMPFLHSTAVNSYSVLFHSQSSYLTKSRETYRNHRRPNVSDVEDALKVFEEMLHSRPLPPVIHFNQILTQLPLPTSPDGKVVEAHSVIEIMFQRHIEPDTITYNSVMDGYCLRGEMDEAEKVFDIMVWKGSMVNVRSCNILINRYCKSKNVDQAYRVFEEMTFRELVPDTITYTTLIYGFCKAGRKQEAEELFSEMRVCGLCNNQQLSSALELGRSFFVAVVEKLMVKFI